MNYGLNKGDFFITRGDETTPIGSGIPYTEEIELSAKETLTRTYSASMECKMVNVNWELFNSLFESNGRFNMEYFIPIMVQARWHKKPRIRKKWLKRFGMKPDKIKCRTNATAGEYHTDDGSFDFESDVPEYLWRPDQLRRGLKIEFKTQYKMIKEV